MANWLNRLMAKDHGRQPQPTGPFAHWIGGRFHLQIGSPDAVILAFGSAVSLFNQTPTPAETRALSDQLDIFAHSAWAADGVAKVALPFPKNPPQVLRIMVQYGATESGDPEQVVEAQYGWGPRGIGAAAPRGGNLTVTNGQSHFIL